ncbi:type I-E CRISPR-associated protein Cse1/CasA [Varibaculum vaginae]|uniref:type I-E CRISPR-associated protein Cse1/CasA n=1 Tax=Varibaculum vaginae TaxID=2364797 RepID=UPI000F081F80|nr:type I-E CRISPR-associated protein Cse1/CasA [Varibaculum vaginae]
MTEKSKFNLLDEPWVPVVFCNGKHQVLPLRDCFSRSPEIRRLSFGQDAVSFAVLRIMVAIMQRTLYVASVASRGWNVSAWQRANENPKETLGLVEQYLETWRDRFFLFDSDYPFFQHPTIHTPKGDYSELNKILADVPNGEPFITMRIGAGLEEISYPEVAAQLIHLQAYDSAGIRSGAVGDPRVKGGKGYPIGTGWVGAQGGVYVEGESLFSTLMLNTLAIGQPGEESEEARATGIIATNPDIDLPAWEREEQPVGQRADIYPHGLADMLTWQSRRVRLIDGGNSVIGLVLCQGDRLGSEDVSAVSNAQIREPMGAWRFSEPQTKKNKQITYMPRKHDPSRVIWRGMTSLLPEFPGKTATYKEVQVEASLPPAVVRWVGWLLSNGYLPESTTYRLRSCGYVYGSNESIFEEAISDYLAIPPRLLTGKDQKSLYLVKTGMELLDELASAIAALAGNLERAVGAEDTKQANRIVRERFYSGIDGAFRAWLLGVGSTTCDLESLWKSGYGIAKKLESELLAAAPDEAMKGREKNGTVFDLPNCVKWFAIKLSKTKSKVSAFNESKENHE